MITNTAICSVYDPAESINNWLAQFDLNAQRLGLGEDQKLIRIGRYLPMEIANLIARSSSITTWTALKTTLIQTYGIPAAKFKQVIRRRLEASRQGNLPSRRLAVLFESVIFEFPVEDSLDTNTLRSIYLRVMLPKVRTMILCNIASKRTWKAISNAATEIEECLSMDEDFLEVAFENLTLNSPAAVQPPPVAQQAEVEPMELDALQHNHRARQNISSNRNSFRSPGNKNQDPMRLRSASGDPICGHCGKDGHLTKKCFSKNKNNDNNRQVHSIDQSVESDSSSPVTVNYVNAILNPDYAVNPIENDPMYSAPGVNSISVTTSESSTSRIKVSLGKDKAVSALIDTGASLTVLRFAVVQRFGLSVDTSRTISFTTANNQVNRSLGMVQVSATIGELPITLNRHVVSELTHDMIIGYPNLKALKVIIDTASNEVRIPKVFPGTGSSGLFG